MEIFKLFILSMYYIVPCLVSNPMCACRSRMIDYISYLVNP